MAFLGIVPLLLLLLRKSSEPVSPMNIFAGCRLNIKNPKHAPHSTQPKTVISNTPYFAAITDRQAIIIIEIDAPSPSIPSVKFTAFVAANITNIANGIYINTGIGISIFSIGIIVPVPSPCFIRYSAYAIDIIRSPHYFVSWL